MELFKSNNNGINDANLNNNTNMSTRYRPLKSNNGLLILGGYKDYL